MVLVSGRDGDDVDVLVAARPEVWGDGFFAGVDGGVFGATREASEGPAAADEERSAFCRRGRPGTANRLGLRPGR